MVEKIIVAAILHWYTTAGVCRSTVSSFLSGLDEEAKRRGHMESDLVHLAPNREEQEPKELMLIRL